MPLRRHTSVRSCHPGKGFVSAFYFERRTSFVASCVGASLLLFLLLLLFISVTLISFRFLRLSLIFCWKPSGTLKGHLFNSRSQQVEFDTLTAFEHWKRALEAESGVRFRRRWGSRKRKDGSLRFRYSCQHNDPFMKVCGLIRLVVDRSIFQGLSSLVVARISRQGICVQRRLFSGYGETRNRLVSG